MTDNRIGAALPMIAVRLPPRSAIVVRAFALSQTDRVAVIRRLRNIARARRHLLIWSGAHCQPGYDGRHGTARRASDTLLVMPVHHGREMLAARRHRADAVLLSPVHPTRSHPGAPVLGQRGFARLAAAAPSPVIALGGMQKQRFRPLRAHRAYGWAAIDGWLAK